MIHRFFKDNLNQFMLERQQLTHPYRESESVTYLMSNGIADFAVTDEEMEGQLHEVSDFLEPIPWEHELRIRINEDSEAMIQSYQLQALDITAKAIVPFRLVGNYDTNLKTSATSLTDSCGFWVASVVSIEMAEPDQEDEPPFPVLKIILSGIVFQKIIREKFGDLDITNDNFNEYITVRPFFGHMLDDADATTVRPNAIDFDLVMSGSVPEQNDEIAKD